MKKTMTDRELTTLERLRRLVTGTRRPTKKEWERLAELERKAVRR